MTLTFGVVVIFAAVLATLGLLLTRFTRWRPVSAVDATSSFPRSRGNVVFVLVVLLFAAVVVALLWGWGVVALPR